MTVKVVTNETTAANLLLTGGANVASIGGPDRTRLNKAHLFSTVTAAQPNELFFNENPGHPGANPAVRKALVQALNLGQLGTVATSGRGLKMTQLSLQNFTPCAGNSVAGSVPAYNPSAARSALAGTSIKLLYATDAGPSYPPTAELAQQQLSSAGAKVSLLPQSTAALQGTIFGGGDWDVLIIGIGVANPSQISALISGPTPPHGINFARHQQSRLQARSQPRDQAGGCRGLQVLARRRAGNVQGRGHRAASGDDQRQLRQEPEVRARPARPAADEPPADEVR